MKRFLPWNRSSSSLVSYGTDASSPYSESIYSGCSDRSDVDSSLFDDAAVVEPSGGDADADSSIDGDEDILILDSYRGANWFGAWVNLANCAVGAGILSLPFAVKTMGVVLAVIVYIVLAFAAWYTLYLLVLCAEMARVHSYEELVEAVFGRWAARLLKVSIIVYTYGVCAGYILAGGDLFASVLREWIPDEHLVHSFFVSDTFLKLLVTLFVIGPLASLRRLDYLKWVSFAALIAVLYFTTVVVVQSSQDIERRKSEIPDSISLAKVSTTVFQGIPIMAFALGGHLQSVSSYSELKDSQRSPLAWGIICAAVVVFLSTLYLLVGILSYLRLLMPQDDSDSGNILTVMVNDAPKDVLVQVAALAMGVVVTFSFPLFSWSMCNAFETLLFQGRPFSWIRHLCETTAIILGTLTIALLVNDLSVVFGIVGSTGAVLLKFLLPSCIYLFLHRASNRGGTIRRTWYHVILSVCILISGALVGVISTSVIVASWFGGF